MLNVGDKAPQFSLPDGDGKTVSLNDYAGQKVLIWFFPKASTPGCTAEGCSLRDHNEAFEAANVQVIGMSKDSPKRQKNFGSKYEFPYPLLSDESGKTIEAFGAWGPKKMMGREYEGILRSSFLINEDGIIERVYNKVKTKTHGADVLADL